MKVHFDDLLMQLNRAENDNKCEYCHWPFKPVMMKKRDGYVEADLYASTMNKFHVNLSEMDGKWYLMIKGLPYPIKYCPNCGRKLDENTKYEMTDWL